MIKNFLFVLAIVVSFTACQESSTVGTVLLEDEKFDIQLKKDFILSSDIIQGESSPGYIEGINYSTFSIGQLDDPMFGTKDSELYFEMGFNTLISRPDFSLNTLDSIVLILAYDTAGYYGDDAVSHSLEILALEEDLTDRDTIQLDATLQTGTDILGSKTISYRPFDSLSITSHLEGEVIRIKPQIRIPMNDVWSEELFSNADLYESDEALAEFFKGFVIKNTTSNSALLGLNMGTASEDLNKLSVYYTDTADIKKIYNFTLRGAKGMLQQIDRSGSLTAELIDGVTSGDSLILMEGHTGYDAKVVFDDLSFLEDKIVNHAVLKITIAELVGDDPREYPQTPQLLARAFDDNGDQQVIDDITDLSLVGISIPDGFGGNIVEEDGVKKYVMNVTKRVKEIMDGDFMNDEAEIIFNPFARIQLPNRCIMYGAKHSVYPIEFEVTYTLN